MAEQELPDTIPLPAGPDGEFDRMAALTRRVLGVTSAAVTLVDKTRQTFVGGANLHPDIERVRTTPLSHSFCQHVVRQQRPFVLADARGDALVSDSPAIVEHRVVAYAGMPVTDLAGRVVGSLCVSEPAPRTWTADELETLSDLAEACSAQLALRESAARNAVAAERDRIAERLTSQTVGDLLTLSMQLASIRTQVPAGEATAVDRALSRVDEILAGIRRSVFGSRRTVTAAGRPDRPS